MSFSFFSEEIEGNVTVIRNYQKLKDLQKNLVWPSVGELDSKSFIPEVYKTLHFTCIVKDRKLVVSLLHAHLNEWLPKT
jgi:hypothetical protein